MSAHLVQVEFVATYCDVHDRQLPALGPLGLHESTNATCRGFMFCSMMRMGMHMVQRVCIRFMPLIIASACKACITCMQNEPEDTVSLHEHNTSRGTCLLVLLPLLSCVRL